MSCSVFGRYYTESVIPLLGTCLPRAVLVFKNGHSACYFQQKELDAFGNALVRRARKEGPFVQRLCLRLKEEATALLALLKKLEKEKVSTESLEVFEKALQDYTAPHLGVKKIVDYLAPDELKKHLKALEEARVFSEPVYSETEKYMKKIIAHVAKQSVRPAGQIESLTFFELQDYFQKKTLPKSEVLQDRHALSTLVFKKGKGTLVSGKKAKGWERTVTQVSQGDLKGTSAYPGEAVGTARVILDPHHVKTFNEGDILVTGMTRPEYLPLFRKAAAVVTDAGGMLCHAAITARELKKPCVVGTLSATKLIREGQKIIVNASEGIVARI